MAALYTHTDLALEARESIEYYCENINGVSVSERTENHQKITKVVIDTLNAAKAIGKPIGTYVTIEANKLPDNEEEERKKVAKCVTRELSLLLKQELDQKEYSVLVVGLGNREVTPDALGPAVLDHLNITRHILKHYGAGAYSNKVRNKISSIEPGVMARTGMETAEIVYGIVRETSPDVVLVVDALAARSSKHLNHTIQLTNTGIQPGSGVANHRSPLTKDSLGVPVIAIGVPTVIDGETFVEDALHRLCRDTLLYNEIIEQRHAMGEQDLHNMYLTGKDVDSVVRTIAYTLAEGINQALSAM